MQVGGLAPVASSSFAFQKVPVSSSPTFWLEPQLVLSLKWVHSLKLEARGLALGPQKNQHPRITQCQGSICIGPPTFPEGSEQLSTAYRDTELLHDAD